jgi:hypothetical protein
MLFISDQGSKFLQDIEKVVLSVDLTKGPNNKSNNQPGADSAFIPTTPLINDTFFPGKIDF